jgi:ion channel-forming bestrophin family protein
MFTKRTYPIPALLKWTRRDIYKFILIALIPVVMYDILDWKWLHLPWLPIALVGTAVAFIVGFKNNASYDRQWEARKIWGGIVNASRSWGILVNDYLSNEHAADPASENELHDIRTRLVYRHLAWLTSLRYLLRTERPWEMFFKLKTNREYSDFYKIEEHRIPFEEAVAPYLSEDDHAYILQKSNKATHCISLQSKDLHQLKVRGLIWEFSYLEMENILVELFTLQGKCERIKNFPYPRQFATLNLYFVWIFIFLLPFGVMSEFDVIGQQLLASAVGVGNVYQMIASNFVWLSIPFSVIISWVFYTMERIGEVSENPFEGTANDIPITTMSRGIEIDLREMLDEPKDKIPEALPIINDIQM